MNREAIGAIGEVAGALVGFITLFNLVIQRDYATAGSEDVMAICQ